MRQHASECSSASPGAGGPPCGSTDGAGAVMLPTNLCLLTSTYEKPHPAHHPAWMRRGASCFTDSRPASEDRTRVCGRASDTSVTTSALRLPLARETIRSRWPSSSPVRSRDRSRREGEPRRLPSSKSPRPAAPFRTPGSDLRLTSRRCRRVVSFATPFHSEGRPCGPLRGSGPRARVRCRRITLLGPRLRLPTSADFRATCGFALASVRSSLRAAEVISRLLAWTEMT